MVELFLQLVLMISLGIIVYLMAVAVPRVKDEPELSKVRGVKMDIWLEQLDNFLNNLRDKTLRRLKVLIMRADNFVSRQLHKNNKKL